MSEEKIAEKPSSAHEELSQFQYTILCSLADRPMYGLELKQAIQEAYGAEINHGRLYPNLDRLVQMGLLEKSKRDNRSNEYAITERGLFRALERIQWEVAEIIDDHDRAQEINYEITEALKKSLHAD